MQHTNHWKKTCWAAAACLAPALASAQTAPAQGAVEPSGWSYSLSGNASVGTSIATSSVAPTPPANGGSLNGNDSASNYQSGDAFGRALKLHTSLSAKHASGLGAVISGMLWYDDSLLHHGVPHGNNPNNYAAGQPLSDNGFTRMARFQGAALLNAYLEDRHTLDQGSLSWRLGRQVIDRESAFTFKGGLKDLDARNVAAMVRPGALPEEGTVPVWAATGRWAPQDNFRVDAFVQLATQANVDPGCGTFFASDDYSAPGCNRAFYARQLTEAQAVARQMFTSRAADQEPSSRPEQAGASAYYTVPQWGTRFGAHFAHYHSRSGITSVIKGKALGPAGNNQYFIEYPENKQQFALSSATRIPQWNLVLANEVSLTSNQALQLNTTDLLNAFLAGSGPLGAGAVAAPANSIYHGYDRYRVVQAQTGFMKQWGALLGASKSFTGAEFAVKHVNGLPDAGVRRYGRPEIVQACAAGASCNTNDGYVTSTAWAYRIKAGLEFSRPMASMVKLAPSLALAHDVHGWSYDYNFVQGRKIWVLSLDAEWDNKVYASLSYMVNRGGDFNPGKGLDAAFVVVGMKF